MTPRALDTLRYIVAASEIDTDDGRLALEALAIIRGAARLAIDREEREPAVLWVRLRDDDAEQDVPVRVVARGGVLCIDDDGGSPLFGVDIDGGVPCCLTWDSDGQVAARLPLHGDVEPATPAVVHAAPDASALHALDVIVDILRSDARMADRLAGVAAVLRERGRDVPLAYDDGPEFPDDPNHDDEREAPDACDECRDADGVPILLRASHVCPACDVSHHGAPCLACGRRGYHAGMDCDGEPGLRPVRVVDFDRHVVSHGPNAGRP